MEEQRGCNNWLWAGSSCHKKEQKASFHSASLWLHVPAAREDGKVCLLFWRAPCWTQHPQGWTQPPCEWLSATAQLRDLGGTEGRTAAPGAALLSGCVSVSACKSWTFWLLAWTRVPPLQWNQDMLLKYEMSSRIFSAFIFAFWSLCLWSLCIQAVPSCQGQSGIWKAQLSIKPFPHCAQAPSVFCKWCKATMMGTGALLSPSCPGFQLAGVAVAGVPRGREMALLAAFRELASAERVCLQPARGPGGTIWAFLN